MHDPGAVAPDRVSQPSKSERIGYGLLLGALTAIVVIALTDVANLLAGLAFPPLSLQAGRLDGKGADVPRLGAGANRPCARTGACGRRGLIGKGQAPCQE